MFDAAQELTPMVEAVTAYKPSEEWPTITETKQDELATKSNYFPFFTKKFIFSNHHHCDIVIDGKTFRSTEHYLFHEKAVKLGDASAAQNIFKAPTAGQAKKLGHLLHWDNDKFGSWHQFAYEKLFTANNIKYDTHANLRKALFQTAPLTLVEASPTDMYWGVGLRGDDPKIHNRDEWPGENKFGFLLTKLRDQMLAHENYKSEIEAIKNKANDSSIQQKGKKRLFESSSPNIVTKRAP